MNTVSQQIDEYISKEGKGNTRDALNIALCRLESAEDLIKILQDEIKDLRNQCHLLMMGES